jgi:hypothetical protein
MTYHTPSPPTPLTSTIFALVLLSSVCANAAPFTHHALRFPPSVPAQSVPVRSLLDNFALATCLCDTPGDYTAGWVGITFSVSLLGVGSSLCHFLSSLPTLTNVCTSRRLGIATGRPISGDRHGSRGNRQFLTAGARA